MSSLPQRKKSPEEIAHLREALGVPGISQASGPHPQEIENHPTIPHQAQGSQQSATTTIPASSRVAAPHHAINHREWTGGAEREPVHPHPVSSPKPVRSLRKSEQAPTLRPVPFARQTRSALPTHRHSDRELSEIRRREALAAVAPPPNPRLAIAHPALLIPGYLLAIAGASCFFFWEFPMEATAACSAAALLIAGFVFLKKPISRHHAAFIAIIALFVIVFGALHFFPQLRHAT